LLLNIFQSVELRYPFVDVLAWEIEIVFDAIVNGDVALEILWVYAVSQFVWLAVVGIAYPAVVLNIPVAVVYVKPVTVVLNEALALASV